MLLFSCERTLSGPVWSYMFGQRHASEEKGGCKTTSKNTTYHLIVLLRLGWLTVLSSINIVEQELYFLERTPGDT